MSDYSLTAFDSIDAGQEAVPARADSLNCDALLLERFQQGDNSALVELYDRHNRRLFTYCLKFVGNSEQAQDMTQEFWMKIMRLREKPCDVRNPLAFFLTVARNLCLNHIKAQRNHSSLDAIPEVAHPVDHDDGRPEMEEKILRAMDKLSFEHREVLILNIYCGYRMEEIAVMLGKSPEAIWKRASRARKHLRELVMESDDNDTMI
jgi:RNA polymerase sigma-70 factor (ECF subfamily)